MMPTIYPLNVVIYPFNAAVPRPVILNVLRAFLLWSMMLPFASAESDAANSDLPEEEVALSIEALKKQVVRLNRDLFILEEDLLFPATTQFAVYLSVSTGQFLELDSVTLKVNDQVVAAHLYTEGQLAALKRGGMQRLHLGNLKSGEHEITALVHGIGPNQQDYKLAASQTINKGSELKALEIRIEDRSENYQPRVSLIEWKQ